MKTLDKSLSRKFDKIQTIGQIISLALERRSKLVPNQKALEAISSAVGIDPRTMRRWIENEGQPDLTQFGAILHRCDYPEGFDQLKLIHFPELN